VLTQSGLKRQGVRADVRSMIWWALVGAASWCLVALAGGVLVGRALDWGAAPLLPLPRRARTAAAGRRSRSPSAGSAVPRAAFSRPTSIGARLSA